MADMSVFDLAERRLTWLDQRQAVLAQNIANANTPGFRPRDLAPFSAQLSLAQAAGAPVRTNPLHLAGADDGVGLVSTRPEELSADGNAVPIDKELSKVSDTDTSQELVSDLYKTYGNMIRTALGR